MPVKFYPEKPIDLLEKYIVKEDGSPLYGEIEIYRKLNLELSNDYREWHVWHDLRLPNHSQSRNPYGKTSAQLDFLILCEEGILVLEVKGGPVSCRENLFFYGKNFDLEMSQDPFRQAEGYKFTLKDNILNSISGCCFCHAVAFPHVDYPFEAPIFDSNILWTPFRASHFSGSIMHFLLSVFRRTKEMHAFHHRKFQSMGVADIDSVKRILSPTLRDRNQLEVPNTLEWLQIDNLEILEGLSRNKRIMIEGPPGSGKTTIAKAFIDQQNGKSGIYLCWNNFLMHYTKKKIEERNCITNVKVLTLTRFLIGLTGENAIESIMNLDASGYRKYLTDVVMLREKEGTLPSFDFIVVDEGQDIFDRGVDIILEKMCGNGKDGLLNGSILLLYDIDQSYSSQSRNALEISHLMSEYFAHFKLSKVRRSAQVPCIQLLASRVLDSKGTESLSELLDGDSTVRLTYHNSLEEVKRFLVTTVLSQIRDAYSSLKGAKCVLLIESILLKEIYNNQPGMNYWLTIKDVEELDENNVADEGNKLRYTSILKFKGLERETVFLVVTKLTARNRYEWFIGITRAISNLHIMIVNP